MNTIQITNSEGQVVNYTEAEVTDAFERVKQIRAQRDTAQDELRKIRNNVRDFFSEGEWCHGESTINREETNLLLESIGCQPLKSSYDAVVRLTININGLEAVDEDEARQLIDDYLEVTTYYGEVEIDDIDIQSLEEND